MSPVIAPSSGIPSTARFGRLATAAEIKTALQPLAEKHFPGRTVCEPFAHTYTYINSKIPVIGRLIDAVINRLRTLPDSWRVYRQLEAASAQDIFVLESGVANPSKRVERVQTFWKEMFMPKVQVEAVQTGGDQVMLRFQRVPTPEASPQASAPLGAAAAR
ncbi:MAG: hypothetical protein IPK79_07560 [Vampirovibrionales bacterium]|nr:hypothetical protein [Vampirovibrionales bacterium]